jgi:hypothetical protein
LCNAAFLSDYMHDPLQFLHQALIGSDYFVKRVGDFAGYTCPVIRKSSGKIPTFECNEGREQLPAIDPVAVVARTVSRARLWGESSFLHK